MADEDERDATGEQEGIEMATVDLSSPLPPRSSSPPPASVKSELFLSCVIIFFAAFIAMK